MIMNKYRTAIPSYLDKGWEKIFLEMDEELRALKIKFRYAQVKEKFGLLRIYLDFGEEVTRELKDIAYDIVHKYEDKSSSICEICGEAGKLVSQQGWLSTRCNKHKDK